jgi:hypothetical protein
MEPAEQIQIDADARITVPENVVFRHFAAETVILNLATGRYHGLNPSGGAMLEALQRQGTIRASVPEIAERFAQPEDRIERDMLTLCRDLSERGLIVSTSGDGS